MQDNPAGGDLKRLWQQQDARALPVTAEEMWRLKQKRESRERRMKHLSWSVPLLFLAFAIGIRLADIEPATAYQGWMSVVWFALLIVFELTYRYYRTDWVMGLNLHAAHGPSLEFYRSDLQARLEYFRYNHRWMPGLPLLLVILVLNVERSGPWVVWPLGLLLAIYVAVWYRQWRREQPQLQAELQALEAYRKQG